MNRWRNCVLASLLSCVGVFTNPQIATGTSGDDGPQFVETFRAPETPKLAPKVLTQEPALKFFRTPDGIILFHARIKRWQIYSQLEGYENQGQLEGVVRGGGGSWAILEKGLVWIRKGNEPRLLPFSTDVLGFDGRFAYFVVLYPRGFRHNRQRRFRLQVPTAKLELKKLDLSTGDVTDVVSMPINDWDELLSWQFHRKRFWLAFGNKTIWLNPRGTIKDLGKAKNFPKRITHFENIGGKLFGFADGVYEVGEIATTGGKIRRICPGSRFPGFESTAVGEGVAYMVPTDAPWKNMLLTFSPKLAKEDRLKLPLRYKETSDPDGVVFFDASLWLLSLKYQVVARWDPRGGAPEYFRIQGGPPAGVRYFAEDDKEVWFASEAYGLTVFNKQENSWRLLPLAWDKDIRHIWQATLNPDYVFVMEYGTPTQFVVVDRRTEKHEVLNSDELRDRFYPGHPEAENMHPWTALLFFLRLPLTGVDSDFNKIIVHRKNYSLASVFAHKNPSDNYSGIYKLDRKTNRVSITKLPKYKSDFDSGIVPYRFTGNDKTVWGVGRGWDSRGIFRLDLPDGDFQHRAEWHQKLFNCWDIGENENTVFVSIQDKGKFLGAVDKKTGEVKLYGDEIGMSRNWFSTYSNQNYDMFGTEGGLVFFDRKSRKWGKKFSQWTTIFDTGHNVYLKLSGDKYYRLEGTPK